MRKVFFIAVVLFMLGCAGRRGSSEILSRGKMEAVMWDIIEADVFTDQFIKRDSTKDPRVENMQLKNKIFALHKISKADYDRSYDYYIVHSDLMKVVLDSMSAKGERDRMKMLQLHD